MDLAKQCMQEAKERFSGTVAEVVTAVDPEMPDAQTVHLYNLREQDLPAFIEWSTGFFMEHPEAFRELILMHHFEEDTRRHHAEALRRLRRQAG
jgi:hypothetical protein